MELSSNDQAVDAVKDEDQAPLGEGAVAVVYAGRLGNKRVAVKQTKQLKDNHLMVAEAKTMRSLGSDHPNVVSLLGTSPSISAAGSQATELFQLVLAPLCHRDLTKWASSSKDRLPLQAVRVVAVGVLRAAQFLIQKQVVHLDWAPCNWMLVGQPGSAEEFVPILVDFNASTTVQKAGTDLVGHINHMSTDILYGGKAVSKADLQSTGFLLLYLLRRKIFGVGDGDGEEDFGDFQSRFPGGEDPTNRNLLKRAFSRLLGSPSKESLNEIGAVYKNVSCCFQDASTSVSDLLDDDFEEEEAAAKEEFQEVIESLIPYSPSKRKHPWDIIKKLLERIPSNVDGLSALTDQEKKLIGDKFEGEEKDMILGHF